MEDLHNLEREVQRLYDETLQPLAKMMAADLTRSSHDGPSRPMVLFLGNHSSGKSSFINHLIGAERQKTGLAPTDDGFTVLTYGETEDALDGQSMVSHPDLAYRRLEKLGPNFLSRLRLKTHPAELLKSMSLIDSPGMIDASTTVHGRGYDFAASVRAFAEMADLILFFFDPDKPGTTGETVSIFNETLVGLDHKLLIVMNKVDLFANIRDFARTYGTLCWNLSKTMKTKDVPHIYNTYLPIRVRRPEGQAGEGIPLGDFDISRDEVVQEIRRAPTRRADNLVSDLLTQARTVAMQGRLSDAIRQHFRSLSRRVLAVSTLCVVLGALGTGLTWGSTAWTTSVAWVAGGIVLAFLVFLGGTLYGRRERARIASPAGLEPFFQDQYRHELTWSERADLQAHWERVRPKLLMSITLLGVDRLPGGFGFRRQLRRLDALIESDIPKLRRRLQRAEPAEAEATPEAAAKK